MNVFIPSDLFALNKLLNYVILRDVYCLLQGLYHKPLVATTELLPTEPDSSYI